jgi:predicted component of type VI protein secretion system
MIPFPKMHIAQSVINRVLNTMEGNEFLNFVPQPAPIPPADPIALGQQIQEQLEVPPVAPVLQPEQQAAANDGMTENSAMGGSPFNGALAGSLGQV